jgi:CHAT domain-containing protein
VLTGRDATETAVKHAMEGRGVIHLATHGFFLGEACDDAPAGTRGVGGLVRTSRRHSDVVDNPLLLSGIALSGANEHRTTSGSADDGILTAEEVAALDLHAADWAVLSACDTGVGEVKAGEGVFGLRRAFQIAGARTVIMSLWSIDDEAVRTWMRALYEYRFRDGRSTADAVRDATTSVISARRARGKSTHPFYWGGMVAVGEWR